MHSSTSSSEPRIPGGNWQATWIVALVLLVSGGWLLERHTRANGQRPSVVDDELSWALTRVQVDDDPRAVAFVGTSRMELALSLEAFASAAHDHSGHQLAIDGVPAFGVLEDLAADPSFHGVVVVDMVPWELERQDAYTAAQAYVSRTRALWRAPGAVANHWLASHVQARLALLAVGGRELLASALGERRWPEPKWVVARRDRTFRGDYQLASPDALARRRTKGVGSLRPPTLDITEWRARAAKLKPLVERITARGGRVVLVHLPISGDLAVRADELYPRAFYWDSLAALTSADTIHYRDVRGMADIECPDFMHIDQRDQARLTTALVEELYAREILRR